MKIVLVAFLTAVALSSAAFGEDHGHRFNIGVSGHHDDATVEANVSFKVMEKMSLVLQVGSTAVGASTINDFGAGISSVSQVQGLETLTSVVLGVSSIDPAADVVIPSKDKRFMFVDCRFSVGMIGVGIRHNNLSVDDYQFGATRLQRSNVYPYVSVQALTF